MEIKRRNVLKGLLGGIGALALGKNLTQDKDSGEWVMGEVTSVEAMAPMEGKAIEGSFGTSIFTSNMTQDFVQAEKFTIGHATALYLNSSEKFADAEVYTDMYVGSTVDRDVIVYKRNGNTLITLRPDGSTSISTLVQHEEGSDEIQNFTIHPTEGLSRLVSDGTGGEGKEIKEEIIKHSTVSDWPMI